MLIGAFTFTVGAVLCANAPTLQHNDSAQRMTSACPAKETVWLFLRANKRFIIPPSSARSPSRVVTVSKNPRAMIRPQLFRVFSFCSGSLTLYRHLKRATQHV